MYCNLENTVILNIDFYVKHIRNLSSVPPEDIVEKIKTQKEIQELLKNNSLYICKLNYNKEETYEVFPEDVIGRIISFDFENLSANIEIKKEYEKEIKNNNLLLGARMFGKYNNGKYEIRKIVKFILLENLNK